MVREPFQDRLTGAYKPPRCPHPSKNHKKGGIILSDDAPWGQLT